MDVSGEVQIDNDDLSLRNPSSLNWSLEAGAKADNLNGENAVHQVSKGKALEKIIADVFKRQEQSLDNWKQILAKWEQQDKLIWNSILRDSSNLNLIS